MEKSIVYISLCNILVPNFFKKKLHLAFSFLRSYHICIVSFILLRVIGEDFHITAIFLKSLIFKKLKSLFHSTA